MSITVRKLDHVNVTVSRTLEAAAKNFYGTILNLREVPKPEASRGRGGAWYQVGDVQLHLSLEDTEAVLSRRHICLLVENLEQARQACELAGVEIFPDEVPTPGWARFYVRDPGGNRIEIASSAPET